MWCNYPLFYFFTSIFCFGPVDSPRPGCNNIRLHIGHTWISWWLWCYVTEVIVTWNVFGLLPEQQDAAVCLNCDKLHETKLLWLIWLNRDQITQPSCLDNHVSCLGKQFFHCCRQYGSCGWMEENYITITFNLALNIQFDLVWCLLAG